MASVNYCKYKNCFFFLIWGGALAKLSFLFFDFLTITRNQENNCSLNWQMLVQTLLCPQQLEFNCQFIKKGSKHPTAVAKELHRKAQQSTTRTAQSFPDLLLKVDLNPSASLDDSHFFWFLVISYLQKNWH